jgi:hypothetical protein
VGIYGWNTARLAQAPKAARLHRGKKVTRQDKSLPGGIAAKGESKEYDHE